ncbi:MAG: thioredoxin family protein [Bacteroidia bacterium]|nr:thioredoxin family protein [Bacteroidia bacterium]MDW8089738.1 thioredoxin family protein [Bacteroidia bacterium]
MSLRAWGRLLANFFFWPLCAIAQQAYIQFFSGSWEALLQEAQRTNKAIFVEFYAVWCEPCKRLERYTFTNPEVAAYVQNHYLAYKVDGEQGEGARLAKQFRVRAYPTLLFLSPLGEQVGKQVGFVEAPVLLGLLKNHYNKVFGRSEESPHSWEKFVDEYRVFFYALLAKAWEAQFRQSFYRWQQGENPEVEALPPTEREVFQALVTWRQGGRTTALQQLHHHLFQNKRLTPNQSLWLGAYALLYGDPVPAEALQWASYATQEDPTGSAYLTQAALYYRLGRKAEAQTALKIAQRELPADHPAVVKLRQLLLAP